MVFAVSAEIDVRISRPSVDLEKVVLYFDDADGTTFGGESGQTFQKLRQQNYLTELMTRSSHYEAARNFA